ncbi:4-carboxymuconolactone decarboxylase [Vibrio viridaestus]|uniref:4-carboxymuconolactone decarboxylase n=1 Tax=Vibrio viridaestus TaxID=2487322 RepID=A0A3N9TJF6_9VIBR|nr:4-carboxymuconolactone decarboxylase [Vibrio viridaestus]
MQSELTQNELAMIPVAANAASGDIEKLTKSLVNGLDSGLSIMQLKEILVQVYAYAGFPRSLNALAALMSLVNERAEAGINDAQGEPASSLPEDRTSLEFGTENQTKLVGQRVSGPLFDFAPEIDTYLKAHLFGDIFQREVLSWKERELATIAMLANIQGVNSQLKAHYGIAMNNGLSAEQLNEFISVLKQECGEDVAFNAKHVLDAVLV